jgi:hypothetical protein
MDLGILSMLLAKVGLMSQRKQGQNRWKITGVKKLNKALFKGRKLLGRVFKSIILQRGPVVWL